MTRPTHPDGRIHGVVVACQRDDGRWLLIRRSRHVAAPLRVCFPGGGVEMGEAESVAAVREFREELGVEVELLGHVWTWDSPDYPLLLQGWHARLLSERITPDPMEVAEVLWLTAEEAAQHPDRLRGTEDFIAHIEQAVANGHADNAAGG